MAIKFIKSPVGAYQLGYAIGSASSFDAKLEKELIEKGYAVEIPKKTDKDESGRLHSNDTTTNKGKTVSKRK